MKTMYFAIILCAASVFFNGCASVQFYSDSGLTQKTGLKVCPAKPYLLVEYNPGKDKTPKTTLLWLPDMANPQYVKLTSGFGSNEMKLAFKNGCLDTYGITTDTKIPESINALAYLMSKTADVAANFAAPPVPAQEEDSVASFELYEIFIEKERPVLRRVVLSDVIK